MTARVSQIQLGKPPIVFVLSQVVISGLLKIAEFIPDIQEGLRKMGYPRTDKANIFELTISAGKGPSVSGSQKWIFSTKANDAAVVVNEKFVVFEVGNYRGFAKFAEDLKDILELFKEITGLDLSERLGLRYINLIREAPNISFNALLQPQLLGLNEDVLGLTETTSFYETRGVSDKGSVSVKLWQVKDGSSLPPDIDPTGVIIPSKPEPGESARILDIDYISGTDRDFLPEQLVGELWHMHDRIESIFIASTTQQALDHWEVAKPI